MTVAEGLVGVGMAGIRSLRCAKDFRNARANARLAAWKARLAGRCVELLPLEEVKRLVHAGGAHYVGIRSVSVERIVGSEGRCRDFTRDFLPRSKSLQARWERVDAAYNDGTDLPPVKLVELGGVYFVRDGNHRVSVARSKQERPFVDAEIVHLDSSVALNPGLGLSDIRRLAAATARGNG
jgi:hypothetical protein